MKLKGKTLETDPSLQISNEETTTTREADESTQTPQGMIPMQVFSLRVDTGSAVYDSILLLDEEGHLFSMEIKDRMGSFKVSRIE